MPGTLVCYVGLGSNLGDRAANLAEARRRLNESGRIVAASSIYETDPWGVDPSQPVTTSIRSCRWHYSPAARRLARKIIGYRA